MIVRKSQQFVWDCLSLDSLKDDVSQNRTRDIPDNSQDPLVILMAIEAIQLNAQKEQEND